MAVSSSVTSTVHRPLPTTARATACLAAPAMTAMLSWRRAQALQREADGPLVEPWVDDGTGGVDVPTHDVADRAPADELRDVVGGEVAAVDQHGARVGRPGAEQVGVGARRQVEHGGDGAVGLDGALGLQPFEDRRARQQGGVPAGLLRDGDRGGGRGAGPSVEADAAVDLHDVDAARPAVLEVPGDVVQRAPPADPERARDGTQRGEVVGGGLRGARLELVLVVDARRGHDDRVGQAAGLAQPALDGQPTRAGVDDLDADEAAGLGLRQQPPDLPAGERAGSTRSRPGSCPPRSTARRRGWTAARPTRSCGSSHVVPQ